MFGNGILTALALAPTKVVANELSPDATNF